MIRCTICKLETQRREAIDVALQGGVSLEEVSRSSGIGKSSLHRHSRHVKAVGVPESGALVQSVPAPVTPIAAIVEPPVNNEEAHAPTKAQLLQRIEMLWAESVEGLTASKDPILLRKPDGSLIEIKGGDLRARAAFIREGRQIVELQGDASGQFERSGPSVAIQIVMPAGPAYGQRFEAEAIEIAMPKR